MNVSSEIACRIRETIGDSRNGMCFINDCSLYPVAPYLASGTGLAPESNSSFIGHWSLVIGHSTRFPRRLPQLNPALFWIHDPGEATILGILAPLDVDALRSQHRQQCLEVINHVVDHVRLATRFKIIRIR